MRASGHCLTTYTSFVDCRRWRLHDCSLQRLCYGSRDGVAMRARGGGGVGRDLSDILDDDLNLSLLRKYTNFQMCLH